MASKARNPIIQFNVTAFIHELGKELKKFNQDVRDELWDTVKAHLKTDITDFKTNEVQTVNGVTSDYKRRFALFNSLADTRALWITETYLRSTVSAMAKNFTDSHIGLYYEYGTGVEMEKDATYESLGDRNPFRVPNTGSPIVSRSRHVGMHSGMFKEKSIWRDIGGNMRVTGSQRGGESSPAFRKYIGEDVQAYHWFRNAVNDPYLKKRMEYLWVKLIKKFRPRFKTLFIVRDFTFGKD